MRVIVALHPVLRTCTSPISNREHGGHAGRYSKIQHRVLVLNCSSNYSELLYSYYAPRLNLRSLASSISKFYYLYYVVLLPRRHVMYAAMHWATACRPAIRHDGLYGRQAVPLPWITRSRSTSIRSAISVWIRPFLSRTVCILRIITAPSTTTRSCFCCRQDNRARAWFLPTMTAAQPARDGSRAKNSARAPGKTTTSPRPRPRLPLTTLS